jgi:hypothetical protein
LNETERGRESERLDELGAHADRVDRLPIGCQQRDPVVRLAA